MNNETGLTVEQRIVSLLDHCSIQKAHFAGRDAGELSPFVNAFPERVASLTLVCPRGFSADAFKNHDLPLLVFTGDQGQSYAQVQREMSAFANARLVVPQGYEAQGWSDITKDFPDLIRSSMVAFADSQGVEGVSLPQGEGETAGISYQIYGDGTPMVPSLSRWLHPSGNRC